MANYAVDASILQPYLPKGVEPDLYKGCAYVSLVGFMFKHTKLFQFPIPLLGTFEEVNLRFYVTGKEGNEIKRGVVFINETVPYKFVAWLANRLYKEHYIAIPTNHSWNMDAFTKRIEYRWKAQNKWNSISVESNTEKLDMKKNSFEEFIFEHYYGYTKINQSSSEEYKIDHPSWKINEVIQYDIHCDFENVYGKDFKFLSDRQPESVMLAEGSSIAVEWKRRRF